MTAAAPTPTTRDDVRGMLHRLADAAIAADDASALGDDDALRRAVEIMARHVAAIRTAIGCAP